MLFINVFILVFFKIFFWIKCNSYYILVINSFYFIKIKSFFQAIILQSTFQIKRSWEGALSVSFKKKYKKTKFRRNIFDIIVGKCKNINYVVHKPCNRCFENISIFLFISIDVIVTFEISICGITNISIKQN